MNVITLLDSSNDMENIKSLTTKKGSKDSLLLTRIGAIQRSNKVAKETRPHSHKHFVVHSQELYQKTVTQRQIEVQSLLNEKDSPCQWEWDKTTQDPFSPVVHRVSGEQQFTIINFHQCPLVINNNHSHKGADRTGKPSLSTTDKRNGKEAAD